MEDSAFLEPFSSTECTPITGMTRASCMIRVEGAIFAAPDVLSADVNLVTELAVIIVADTSPSQTAATEVAITKADYAPKSATVMRGAER